MIRAQIQKDGCLKITADNISRTDLRHTYEIGHGYYGAENMVKSDIWHWNFHFVKPETVGALTDSPIIQAGNKDVWWFPNYQIMDPWEELKNKGRVIFDPEENNKSLPANQAKTA